MKNCWLTLARNIEINEIYAREGSDSNAGQTTSHYQRSPLLREG